MKYNLIGIHAKPRAGKDTLCNYLSSQYGLLRHGPSVHVKDAAAAMFNVPRSYFDDDKMKDEIDPFWGISYREMAQKVGKESSRDIFGDLFWMRHVEKKLQDIADKKTYIMQERDARDYSIKQTIPYEGIVLADIRYANEAEWVRAKGGVVIFIERKNRPIAQNESHPAERGLDHNLADIILYNNGTVEDLYVAADVGLETYERNKHIKLIETAPTLQPAQVESILEPTQPEFLGEAEIGRDLLKTLSPADLMAIKQVGSVDELILFHHGPGTFIRNKYKMWDVRNPHIVLNQGQGHPYHPDTFSNRILVNLWRDLQLRK